jgi:hypothetical protein
MTSTTSRFSAFAPALLLALPACGDLTDVPAVVVNVDYRPNGDLVVFSSGGVKTYQGDFSREIGSFPIGSGDPYDLQYKGTQLSDDGQVAAVTVESQNNRTSLYRIPDGAPLGSLQPAFHNQQFVALSPKGDKAFGYAGHQGGDPGSTMMQTLYNLADGSVLWSVDYQQQIQQIRPVYCWTFTDTPPGPVFAPDGATIFLAFGEHLMAADVASGAMHEIASLKACIGGLTLLPDGTLLVLHGLDGATGGYPGLYGAPLTDPDLPDAALPNSFAIYTQEGVLLRQIPPFAGYYAPATIWAVDSPIYCSPLGDRCAMFAERPDPPTEPNGDGVRGMGGPSFVLVFGLGGTLLYTIPAPAVMPTAAFSPDGSRLAVSFAYSETPASSARIYRAEDGTLLAERTYTMGVF